ncbi:unnamed protein product [Meloidogyne enterolobii]|uniref:Uncharacterized protein n=1 Tax=Meloidogyne enterolobii TaxID=390850 RepID=A0ACB1A5M7_MELEN
MFLSDEFCAYKFIEDTKLLTPVIDLIFDKAVEEPHFCPLYSDLCKKQVSKKGKEIRFSCFLRLMSSAKCIYSVIKHLINSLISSQIRQTINLKSQKRRRILAEIITKSQRTFLASDEYDNKVKELTEKLETADDKTRVLLEEELETRRSKEKRRLLGIIKFIGQLYRHQLLIETIIDWCAVELVRRFEATHDEVYIE